MNKTAFFLMLSRLLAVGFFVFASLPVLAETIPLKSSSLRIVDGIATLDAQYEVLLSEPLKEALDRGVPLYFALEWRATKPRWYWFDAVIFEKEELLDVKFSPLTLHYRVSSGWLTENVPTLAEAQRLIGNIASRPLFSVADLDPKGRYQLSFRLSLVKSKMPKSLRFPTLSSKELTLSSDWTTLDFYP
ncbi:MAG: DUF4390 domain-containing protein [Burkholderiales bacterium]|jgi:hypothetical protein|nr:DUF4390 domain-containing protein [Burkholderiales bacterium]